MRPFKAVATVDRRDELIAEVEAIDPEAAKWLRANKDRMRPSARGLASSFAFAATPQRSDFWLRIYKEINKAKYRAQMRTRVQVHIHAVETFGEAVNRLAGMKIESEEDRACRLEHERVKEVFYPAPRQIKREWPDLRPWSPAWLAPIGDDK